MIYSIIFYSISFYSIPFYSILLYCILFHSISFFSIPFHFILFYFIPFHCIAFYSILFYSISFHSISFHFIPFHSISFHSILIMNHFKSFQIPFPSSTKQTVPSRPFTCRSCWPNIHLSFLSPGSCVIPSPHRPTACRWYSFHGYRAGNAVRL